MLDWFREVTRLFSLTPMKDDKLNNIQQFYTLSERVHNAPVINWSDKFIRMTEEKYHNINAFAQVNKFKYSKYDQQSNQQDENDFDLIFNDQALVPEKEFKSKFFSGIVNNFQFQNKKRYLDTFQFFEKEVKENEKKGVEIKYKEKNNRFHIFHADNVFSTHTNISIHNGSEKMSDAMWLSYASFESLKWENLIKRYYNDFPKLMERLYFVTYEITLNEVDIHNFSFFSRIYIEKLGSYFLPNKITYSASVLGLRVR